MINLTQVSLRQARQDCAISATGGLKNVQEFKDRLGAASGVAVGNYSLKDLAGRALCKSTSATTGDWIRNTNPGAGCRPNRCEVNVWSPVNYMTAEITKNDSNQYLSYKGAGGYGEDCLVGHSFVGTIPPGSARYYVEYHMTNGSGTGALSYELIGWPSGYFSGTPVYYDQIVANANLYGTTNYTLNGSATPYITLCLQVNAGPGVFKNGTVRKVLMRRN